MDGNANEVQAVVDQDQTGHGVRGTTLGAAGGGLLGLIGAASVHELAKGWLVHVQDTALGEPAAVR